MNGSGPAERGAEALGGGEKPPGQGTRSTSYPEGEEGRGVSSRAGEVMPIELGDSTERDFLSKKT